MIRVEPFGSEVPSALWEPARSARVMLHSAPTSDSKWSRWSYLPDPVILSLRCEGGTHITTLKSADRTLREWSDPLAALAWLGDQCRENPVEGPPFKGGWIGWLSYDLGRLFETLPSRCADDLGLPLFEFLFHPRAIAFDHTTGRAYRVSCGDDPRFDDQCRANELEIRETPERFRTAGVVTSGDPVETQSVELPPRKSNPPVSNFSRDAYERAVARAIEYVHAGDVFQVNLSQRFSGPAPYPPREVYGRLLKKSAAWFGAYFDAEDYALASNSPELFLRVTPDARTGRRHIVTRPIKGTRPRLAGMDRELRDSAKDQAELNMIVDLERNDLGRVCEIGSVKVTERRTIESHPTVFHGAATVEGVLRDDASLVDLLRATFPGGSVTGAPKIRAMEIIEELEPVRRGPYCGAIGYLGADGHIEFNVAIRTMIFKAGQVHIPVGGGIVADSEPAREYEETLVKARAMFAALGVERNASE